MQRLSRGSPGISATATCRRRYRILIRDDHVIVDMLKGLGAEVRAVREPFDPEGGAYGQHNHDLDHPHGHVHDKRHG